MISARSTPRTGAPTVFIGSSTEGIDIGRHLQRELENTKTCSVTRWDQDVFQASTYTIDGLVNAARNSDFAVLIATADDTVTTRGDSQSVARDNVVFELGLFIGALGRERTYVVADRTRDLQLPSDLAGLTWLPYTSRADGNIAAAVNDAVLGITARIRALGPRTHETAMGGWNPTDARSILATEINRVCTSAQAQGWRVRKNSDTTLRLQNRAGRRFTFTIGEAIASREDFRRFTAELRANGLRVSRSLRQPAAEAPQYR
jgi:hypothetical protein